MEVILREHVDNLGKRGEIVKVADGYARNYLLPRKLALLATDGNRKQIEREREKFEAKESEERKAAEALSARMGSLEIQIPRRVGENEVLFGSVTSERSRTISKRSDPSSARSCCTTTRSIWRRR
jgi:large subunit ribosomal protein L9